MQWYQLVENACLCRWVCDKHSKLLYIIIDNHNFYNITKPKLEHSCYTKCFYELSGWWWEGKKNKHLHISSHKLWLPLLLAWLSWNCCTSKLFSQIIVKNLHFLSWEKSLQLLKLLIDLSKMNSSEEIFFLMILSLLQSNITTQWEIHAFGLYIKKKMMEFVARNFVK